MHKSIFFAYESGHQENRDAIQYGITEYNKHQKTYRVISWEGLKIGGQILITTIFKAIDNCDIFTCDLTYQNHNVLFELGYAIGKKKNLLILINENIKDAKDNYLSSRILKTIGYDTFTNGKDILKAFQQKNSYISFPLDTNINISENECDTYDLLFLSSIIQNQAALDLGKYFIELNAKIINNNSSEVDYQTLVWYLTSIAKCKNVLIHFLGKDNLKDDFHNAEYSLFAGISCGMNKTVMLLAPKPFVAPIDYTDILIEYEYADDCIIKTSSWIEKRIKDTVPSKVIINKERENNLLKLGIGYEIAEEEEENLLKYFIEIDSYKNALKRNSSIITGRKGTGKSALYIKLKNYYDTECKKSINIFLKPESDELIDNLELTKIYSNDKTKKTLLLTVWRYVFFSKVFENLHNRISKQLPSTINTGSLEEQVIQLFEKYNNLINRGPFSVMSLLYNEWEKEGFNKPEILNKIYINILSPIINIVKKYLLEHKYIEINLLADNLDKTWDSQSNLRLQSDLILSLLEFNGKIPSELHNDTIKAHTIIILRTDIYEYILTLAREPDKIEVKRIEIDWSKYPGKLKDLLEARFKFILDLPESMDTSSIWKEYFNIDKKLHPFDVINKIVIERPRDIIYFVSKLFESALNNNHNKVDSKQDLNYATEAYTSFLYNNMIAETKAEYPEVIKIFAKIQKISYSGWILFDDFIFILKQFNYNKIKIEKFVNFLLSKQYLIAFTIKNLIPLHTYEDIINYQSLKKFIFFKKYKIFVVWHPKTFYNISKKKIFTF